MKIQTAIVVILLIFAVGVIGGCSTISKWVDEENVILRGVVTEAVQDSIGGEPQVRGTYIDGVEAMRDYVDDNAEARADQLADHARELLEKHEGGLSDKKRRGIELVIRGIEEAISRYRDDDLLEEGERVRVLKVLDWIEQAAYEASVSAPDGPAAIA